MNKYIEEIDDGFFLPTDDRLYLPLQLRNQTGLDQNSNFGQSYLIIFICGR
jgi:hypothetical protein